MPFSMYGKMLRLQGGDRGVPPRFSYRTVSTLLFRPKCEGQRSARCSDRLLVVKDMFCYLISRVYTFIEKPLAYITNCSVSLKTC